MKNFVFTSTLFFIFVLQAHAQYHNSGGRFSNDYSSYRNFTPRNYATSSGKSSKVNSYEWQAYLKSDEYQNAVRYITAMYKTYGAKPTEPKPVDKRTEFSENK